MRWMEKRASLPFSHESLLRTLSIHPYNHRLGALMSPMGEFPGYWDWLWCHAGFRPCWCQSPFPLPFILGVFDSIFFICHWILFVFLLYGRRIVNGTLSVRLIIA